MQTVYCVGSSINEKKNLRQRISSVYEHWLFLIVPGVQTERHFMVTVAAGHWKFSVWGIFVEASKLLVLTAELAAPVQR